MYYIMGLGNPGAKYARSRHNAGWVVLDRFIAAAGLPSPVGSTKYVGRVSEGVLDGEEVTVLYPDTYMNASGSAAIKLVPPEHVRQLVVIYDDIDLPFGALRVSVGRGAGGHNGVQSIIQALGSKNFVRVRIGIAPTSMWTGKPYRPTGEKLSRYVLGNLTRREERLLADAAERACGALRRILAGECERAMAEYNQDARSS